MTDFDPGKLGFALETLGGKRVLFVMAAQAEYGDRLKARIRPLMTGVGPIEAALHTGIALSDLEHRGTRPDLVISLGSAGSRTLEQGAVYQVASVSWRDIDASPLGFTKGVTPFLDHPVETMMPTPIAGVPSARLATGSDIVSGAAYDAIDADMVDMETFAVLRACQRFNVPLVGLRGISDGAADLHHYDDWATLLHVIDAKLAEAIDRLAAAVDSGRLAV
ncbi:5'-methylthioadenosine/S-adenosylhomocysteine nucleosidase [Jiella mangrovi]|uniref:5'-methylthioadenosine/S-adenosylhomocysteine nucleosidase n=1 Tax=Jiella mangrovi TaxID=2821407 RepID=A0ABS4BGK6_9HYPH|nr:5'-methylthioadenosine/S-adenosylhomocysteine nucleosidase [Jiella mangrovi]MBP0615888.1 5'-methylthioadenosine/S-adenosylhomocysteine nucleosidase [Jiella mangrovi]